MNAKVLLLVAASVALAGCPDKPADKPAAPAPKVAAAPPPPPVPEASPARAQAPKADAPTTAERVEQARKISAIKCAGTCDVKVKVSKTATGCTVDSVSAEVIDVQPGNAPTIIKWQIDGPPGFKFAQPGIAFNKPSGAPPAGVMTNGPGGGAAITVTDKHTGPATKGQFEYMITVTDGTAKCDKDPWVDNN